MELDLSAVEEDRLDYELERRKSLRAEGKCDYCERPWSSPPLCKFPDRHSPPREVRLKAKYG